MPVLRALTGTEPPLARAFIEKTRTPGGGAVQGWHTDSEGTLRHSRSCSSRPRRCVLPSRVFLFAALRVARGPPGRRVPLPAALRWGHWHRVGRGAAAARGWQQRRLRPGARLARGGWPKRRFTLAEARPQCRLSGSGCQRQDAKPPGRGARPLRGSRWLPSTALVSNLALRNATRAQ